MKKTITALSIVIILFLFIPQARAQTNALENVPFNSTNNFSENHFSTVDRADTSGNEKIKGSNFFYVTTFYQFTQFKNLELISHLNNHKLYEGNTSYQYPQEDIDEYNNNYDTEYQNNMYGLKVGYYMEFGLRVSGYVGLDQYSFKSWISQDGHQYNKTDKPAITYGFAVDYQNVLYQKLMGMAMFTYNYTSAKPDNAQLTNNSGNPISSISFTSGYWELNLVLGYPLGNFLPYAGAGYTDLYVDAVHEEVIPNTLDNGEVFYDRMEFNSKFKGKSVYGFAGVIYQFNKNLSMYVRSAFSNPLRANVGLTIIL